MQKIMLHAKLKIIPVLPKNVVRRFFFRIVTSSIFENFIMFIIFMNTLSICLDYYDSPDLYNRVLDLANYVFVGVFGGEAMCKLIGFGPKFYFLDPWNDFDFIIVVLSFITIDPSIFSFKVTALRIIRVARLLKMIKVSKGLRGLLKTMVLAVGNVKNVAILLCLVYTTFTIAGMELFGNLQYESLGDYSLEPDANFDSFYIAFMFLFRAETGENWNSIMHDCYW